MSPLHFLSLSLGWALSNENMYFSYHVNLASSLCLWPLNISQIDLEVLTTTASGPDSCQASFAAQHQTSSLTLTGVCDVSGTFSLSAPINGQSCQLILNGTWTPGTPSTSSSISGIIGVDNGGCGCAMTTRQFQGTPVWTYGVDDAGGPANWVHAYPLCGGSHQSPIAIMPAFSGSPYPAPQSWYASAVRNLSHTGGVAAPYTVSVVNTGESLQFRLPSGLGSVSGGPLTGNYELSSIHFHWTQTDQNGGEHLTDTPTASEMHIIHWNTKYPNASVAKAAPDGLAVFAITFQLSDTGNPWLDNLLKQVEQVEQVGEDETAVAFNSSLDVGAILPSDYSWRWATYNGSLTAPPCTENVQWIILASPSTISLPQLQRIQSVQGDLGVISNVRPVQRTNGRVVTPAYQPGPMRTGLQSQQSLDAAFMWFTFALETSTSSCLWPFPVKEISLSPTQPNMVGPNGCAATIAPYSGSPILLNGFCTIDNGNSTVQGDQGRFYFTTTPSTCPNATLVLEGSWDRLGGLKGTFSTKNPCSTCSAASTPFQASPHWRYNSSEINGPPNWYRSWPSCAGQHQSPIVLNPQLKNLVLGNTRWASVGANLTYNMAPAAPNTVTMKNNGEFLGFALPDGMGTVSGGPLVGTYKLGSFHFHWEEGHGGSEHVIPNVTAALEMHIIHYNNKYPNVTTAVGYPDGLSVFSLIFQISNSPNPWLTNVLADINKVLDDSTSTPVTTAVDMSGIFPSDFTWKWSTYPGSLTTPPCAESVQWIALGTTATLSLSQLQLIQALKYRGQPIGSNARPLQPLNGRVVSANYKSLTLSGAVSLSGFSIALCLSFLQLALWL